jgi:hypothetical protein
MQNREKFWLWGYMLDAVPGHAMFVDKQSYSSLETCVSYLGCEGAFWMNSLHDIDALTEENMDRLAGIPQVICGLTHVETNGPGLGGWKLLYKESAARISELSLKYPAIKGALIDDFRSETGPSRDITPEELHEINVALKSKNPDLKLYIVQYHTTQNSPVELQAYKNDFDGISIWNWVHTEYFWRALYADELRHIREALPGKEIIQGQFLHNFGDGWVPMALDNVKFQCDRISEQLEAGNIDGWCVIQSGFFGFRSHREQVEYVRNFWNWYWGTHSVL